MPSPDNDKGLVVELPDGKLFKLKNPNGRVVEMPNGAVVEMLDGQVVEVIDSSCSLKKTQAIHSYEHNCDYSMKASFRFLALEFFELKRPSYDCSSQVLCMTCAHGLSFLIHTFPMYVHACIYVCICMVELHCMDVNMCVHLCMYSLPIRVGTRRWAGSGKRDLAVLHNLCMHTHTPSYKTSHIWVLIADVEWTTA